MPLYMQETIDVKIGLGHEFLEKFSDIYVPLMRALGARLLDLFQSTFFSTGWPQFTVLWEVPGGWEEYAKIEQAHLASLGADEAPGSAWQQVLAGIGVARESRLMYSLVSNSALIDQTPAALDSPLIVQERTQTKPGLQDDYVRELIRLYVPWSATTGKLWLGSFTSYFRCDEIIHYWGVKDGWQGIARGNSTDLSEPPPEVVTWLSLAPTMRDRWQDFAMSRVTDRLVPRASDRALKAPS